jgi:uncharacterized protein
MIGLKGEIQMQQEASLSVFQRIVRHPAFLLIVGFVVVVAFMVGAAAFIQTFAPPPPGRTHELTLLEAVLTATMCMVGYWLFVRFIERKPFADFALTGAAQEWGFGAAIGVGAMVATVGVIWALGGYQVTGHNGPEILVGVLAVAIISGITEEVLIRGVVFRFLEKWLGSVAALGLSAFLFGVLHLSNPGASWLAAIAIALEAGILLGAVYMLTRRLWAAIGLHMAWNSVQGGVFGVKVSGTDVKGLLISEPHGADLLTGGAFGAEASIPAIIICTSIGIYCLWLAYQKGHVIAPSWHRFKTGEALPPS